MSSASSRRRPPWKSKSSLSSKDRRVSRHLRRRSRVMSFGKIFTIRLKSWRINTESRIPFRWSPRTLLNITVTTSLSHPSKSLSSVYSKTRVNMWTCIRSTSNSWTSARSWMTPSPNVYMITCGSFRIWINSMISPSTRSSSIRPSTQPTSIHCTNTSLTMWGGQDDYLTLSIFSKHYFLLFRRDMRRVRLSAGTILSTSTKIISSIANIARSFTSITMPSWDISSARNTSN